MEFDSQAEEEGEEMKLLEKIKRFFGIGKAPSIMVMKETRIPAIHVRSDIHPRGQERLHLDIALDVIRIPVTVSMVDVNQINCSVNDYARHLSKKTIYDLSHFFEEMLESKQSKLEAIICESISQFPYPVRTVKIKLCEEVTRL